MRIIGGVIPKVCGAFHFNIWDIRSGFQQVELDEGGSKLYTLQYSMGEIQVKRLQVGLTCSEDVFKEKMGTVFGKHNGLCGISDDNCLRPV